MVVSVFVTICQFTRNDQPRQRVTRDFNWNRQGNKTLFELGTDAADEKIGIPIDIFHVSANDTADTGTLRARIEDAGSQYTQLLALAHSKGFVDVDE